MRVSTTIAVTLFLSPSCLAQEMAIVTDTELRAAYCLGVNTAQLEIQSVKVASLRAKLRARTVTADDRISLQIEEDIETLVRVRRDRFRDYLMAKGFLGGGDVRESKSALVRGPADVKGCAAENDDSVIVECKRQCGPIKTPEAGERCDTRCGSDACVRVNRCLQQFLPF